MAFSFRRDRQAGFIFQTGIITVVLLSLALPARAQQTPPSQQPQPAQPAAPSPTPSTPAPPTPDPSSPPAASGSQTPAPASPAPDAPKPDGPVNPAAITNDRIFGVLPNYNTVEGAKTVAPITSGESFKIAALSSFDPMVWPLFGFIAGVNQATNSPEEWGHGWSGYGKRYAAAFADNTVCSLVTTGLMPSILKQDPRYYQGREKGFFRRVAYAASRSVVTKSRSGEPQFNLSEIGGTLVVANVSNLYYPASERNAPDTLQRWGMQAMWDTVANELKEFWPDIRKALHGL